MLYTSFLALATVGTATYLNLNVAATNLVQSTSSTERSDSTIIVSIKATNIDSRPTVVVEKMVPIPVGYQYVDHHLDLKSAFPVEGMEGSTEWVEGPNHSWSVYSQAKPDENAGIKQVTLRATASPGRKNMEIGAEATLYINLKKVQGAN